MDTMRKCRHFSLAISALSMSKTQINSYKTMRYIQAHLSCNVLRSEGAKIQDSL